MNTCCRICMKERITIMQALRDDKYKIINDNSDISAERIQ
jgi:hypothetical protein